jgi:hypothetical protein
MNNKIKVIVGMCLTAMTTISATEYLVILDNKHYKSSIVVKPYVPPLTEPVAPPVQVESPYTERETLNLDWKTENDKQILLDTSTGLEWLTLNNTDAMSITQVELLLNTTYQGFRLPTQSEVVAFMQINFPTRNFSDATATPLATGGDALVFADKMGYSGSGYSIGIFKNNQSSGTIVSFSGVRVGNYIYNMRDFSTALTGSGANYAVYLVSEGGFTYSSLANPAINTPVN